MEYLPSFSQEEADLFLESCYALVYEDEQTYKSINSSFDYGHQLILIEKDLRRLASSNHHSTTSYEALILLRKSIGEIQRNFPLSSFSPYIDLYFKTDKICRANDRSADEFLDQLKHALTQTEFKKNIINKRKAVSKNKQSLMRYIEALFEYRARLLVIRVDLGYKRDDSGFINISESERIDLLDGIKNKEVLEKWARDSKILDIFEGTQQIQQLIIARRELGKSSSELKGEKSALLLKNSIKFHKHSMLTLKY